MIKYKNNILHIENISFESLCKKYGTPIYCYSSDKIISNFKDFDQAFNNLDHLICYAMKANSNGEILRILAQSGAGVDITSGGELFRALNAGFSPEKIVYAGIGKMESEIRYALQNRILMFNVESMEEVEAIDNIARRMKTKASVAFRINPNVDPHTHKYITTGKSGSKFGISYKDAIRVYKNAKRYKNINLVGIHSHIGSQIIDTKPFHLAAIRIANIVKELKEIGIFIRYIDLGGGLGIKYHNEKPATPSELREAIIPPFKDFVGTFILEPGRYIVGNSGVLVTKVIYRKKSEGKNYLIVDAGMNDLIRPTLYNAYHEILPVSNPNRSKVKVDVVGPICESGDFLGKERMLPWLEQGEYLAVLCSGAYGFSMSSQYNSRVRSAEVLVSGNRSYLIRKREDYQDLISNEILIR